MKTNQFGLVVLSTAVLLTGCYTPDGRPDRTASGALIGGGLGAATGAIIGNYSGHNTAGGAAIGGAIGLLTGALVGNSIDQQERARLRVQAPMTLQRVEQGQPLSTADVKALAKAGMSDEVIISQIRSTHTGYHLSTAEIIELKDAGVSNRVIDFMINSTGNSLAGPPPVPAQEAVEVATVPPAPLVEEVYDAPGPGYVWVTGYWGWYGGRWVWYRGSWCYPPHRHALWVGPRYERRGGTTIWFSGHWR